MNKMEKFELTIIWTDDTHSICTFHSYDDLIMYVIKHKSLISQCWERN